MKVQDLIEYIQEESKEDREYKEIEKLVLRQLYKSYFYESSLFNIQKKDVPQYYNYKEKFKAFLLGKDQLKIITVLYDLSCRNLIGINCGEEDIVSNATPQNPDIDLLFKRLHKLFFEDKDGVLYIKNKEYFHVVVLESMADDMTKLNQEFDKINKQKEELEKLQSNIFIIVAILVSIVPLITANIQILMNSFSLTKLFAVNGVLIVVIAFIFSVMEKVTKKEIHIYRSHYFWFGVMLLVLAVIASITMHVLSCFFPGIGVWF